MAASRRDYFRAYHYRDAASAKTYDQRKFGSRTRARYNRATQKTLDRALRLLPDGSRILDMPCGTGRWTEFVIRKRMEYVGGDISREMMDVCLEKHKKTLKAFDLVQLDGTSLPFQEGVFDAVLTFKFLSLLPEDIRLDVLKELRRVTRRYLIAQSKHMRTFCPWRTLKIFFSRIFHATWRVRKHKTRVQLPRQIQSAGFRPVARLPIRTSILDFLWPFNLEYLAVLESAECGVRNADCGMRNAGCGMRSEDPSD
jgi:ubiquinone/menaquinone biosynthesis C-methylase UbiE